MIFFLITILWKKTSDFIQRISLFSQSNAKKVTRSLIYINFHQSFLFIPTFNDFQSRFLS